MKRIFLSVIFFALVSDVVSQSHHSSPSDIECTLLATSFSAVQAQVDLLTVGCFFLFFEHHIKHNSVKSTFYLAAFALLANFDLVLRYNRAVCDAYTSEFFKPISSKIQTGAYWVSLIATVNSAFDEK